VTILTKEHDFFSLPFLSLMCLLSLMGFLCILCLALRNWKRA
jgi:hypothetical protein